MEGDQAQQAHQGDAGEGDEEEQQGSDSHFVLLAAPETVQEERFGKDSNAEQDQFGKQCFPQFIFQKTKHYACTSP